MLGPIALSFLTQGPPGGPGPAGTAGPAGPSGIYGKVTAGTLSSYQGEFDWLAVPQGSTVIVWTMPDGPLVDRESADLWIDVRIRDTATKRLVDGWKRTMYAINNSGTVANPDGTAASDVDVTATVHATSTLPGLAVKIVVSAGSLAIQITTPTATACDVKADFGLLRDLALGTTIVPLPTSITPGGGPANGGTIAEIAGSRFVTPNPATSVTICGVAHVPGDGATPGTFHVDSDSQITVCTGIHSGAVTGDVVVASVAGAGPTLTNAWQYSAGTVPDVLTVTPSSGLASAVTSVVIGGLHFNLPTPAIGVTFAGVAGIIDSIDSDGSIHARATSTSGGAVTGDVLVTSPAGGIPLVGGWTYVGPPNLTATVIDVGQYEGGSTASGTGTGLTGSSITFDGVAGTNVVIGGAGTTWRCTVPAMTGTHASVNGGYVSVQASNGAGPGNTLSGVNGFYYLPSQTFLFHNPRFGTTPAAPSDGTAISVWLDGTGTTTSQTQTTPANEPTYVAAGIGLNGQPAIRTSPAGGIGGVTQFFSGVPAAAFGALTMTWLWVGSKHTTPSSTLFEADENTSPTSAGAMELLSSTNQTLFTSGSGTASQTATVMTADTAYCVSARYDGTHATIRVNGADGPQGNYSTPFTGLVRYGFGNPLQASNAQIDNAFELISLKSWATADFTSFSTYTNHKFGIAAA